MRTIRILAAMLLLISAGAYAQEKPVVEIGTSAGAVIEMEEDETLTIAGIPGQGVLSQPVIYATLFAGEHIFIEPRIGLAYTTVGSYSSTNFGFGMRLGRFFDGSSKRSAYVAADMAFYSASYDSGSRSHSSSDVAFGGALGYRFLIRGSVGLRIEGGGRRWLDGELNEIALGISIGGIVHASR